VSVLYFDCVDLTSRHSTAVNIGLVG